MRVERLCVYISCAAIFILQIHLFSCTPVQKTAHPAQKDISEKNSQYAKSRQAGKRGIVVLKDSWGDTLALYGGVGIFTGQHPSSLRYGTVVDRIEKELGIDIRKMDLDNVPQDVRGHLYKSGIVSIYRQRPSHLRKAVAFYRVKQHKNLLLFKNSQICKTNWMGKYTLSEELIDLEIISPEGELLHALFRITYKGKEKPAVKWMFMQEDRTAVKSDDQARLKELLRRTKVTARFLCGKSGVRHVFPSVLCK